MNNNKENAKSNKAASIAAMIGSSALALSFSGCGMTAEDINELSRQMGDFRETETNAAKERERLAKNNRDRNNSNNSSNNKRRVTDNTRGFPQAPTRNPTRNYSDREAIEKFSLQKYRYIDAKVLANFWGERTPYDAKLRLGRKMLRHGPNDGRINMNEARVAVLRKPESQWGTFCLAAGYSFADIEKLGRYWGEGTWKAKVKVSRRTINNQDRYVSQALAAARNY